MIPSSRLGWLLGALCILPSLGGCEAPTASQTTAEEPAKSADPPDPLPALRAFEAEKRNAADFAKLLPTDARLGADPYAIAALSADRFVALLRGRDVVVVLDAAKHELSRLPAPGSPTGMALTPDGKHVLVVGEREGAIARYAVLAEAPFLRPAGRYELEGVRGLRDVAAGPEGVVYAVEEHDGRLLTLWPDPSAKEGRGEVLSARREETALCEGPIDVERVAKFVVTNCVLDHAIVIRPVDGAGRALEAGEARVVHDGPIWSFSAKPDGDGLFLAAGGVEDHPLDRREGFFGYIDSFVTTYRVAAGKPQRLGAVNVGELGVVTPKAMLLDEGKNSVLVTGYGGERRARLRLDAAGAPVAEGAKASRFVSGTRAIAALPGGGFVAANPMLDAFVVVFGDEDEGQIVPASDPSPEVRQSAASRLGEALFFTNLMAPDNVTTGAHSRFSCETCHFEGYGDGRIHHTGRGEVRVVTKPLVGLFNNRPHFSRALDPDLSAVAHAEFRVAGAGSDHSPWFSLDAASHPTIAALEKTGEIVPTTPLDLRRALMAFLMDFTHRTNPRTSGRTPTFTPTEREGAERFRARCEGCHEARLSTDEPKTRVAFESWESFVFAKEGAIVWAMHEYRKTGVVPYVHENGARVPSLRRLYKKHPYLTSGAAKTIDDLLARVRFCSGNAFFHDNAPAGETCESLDAHEREVIGVFLDLL